MIPFLVIYITLSVITTIVTLTGWVKKENYLRDVPTGDLDFYDTSYSYNIFNFIFLPSFVFIFLYLIFIRFINFLINR
jgi:hypothetical protein